MLNTTFATLRKRWLFNPRGYMPKKTPEKPNYDDCIELARLIDEEIEAQAFDKEKERVAYLKTLKDKVLNYRRDLPKE